MDFNEDQLPQKQRLPRALKKYGRSDSEWRENCPVNGTRLFQQPKPLTEEAKNAYRNRKERGPRKTAKKRELGDESRPEESGGNGVKRRKASSPLGGTQPDPTTFQGAFHMFSINNPLVPAVRIDEHLIPPHASTTPIHSSRLASPNATETHDKGVTNLVSSAIQTQPQSLYSINDASSAMANARAAHPSSTTLHLAMDKGLPWTNHASSPSPTRCSGSPTSSAASPPTSHASGLSPASSDEQENGWATDEFIATDRSFFVPRSPSTCHPDQAPAPEMSQHHADALHQAISEPAPLTRSTATYITSSISSIASNDIGQHDPQDVNRGSVSVYIAQADSEELIARSASPVVTTQIDEQLHDMVNATNDFGYALSHATDVHNSPQAIPSSIHPRPPKLSSYSELAPASHFAMPASANHHTPPSVDAPAMTFHTTTPSEFADALLHGHRSARVPGIYSQEPVYLTRPYVTQEVTLSEDEYAHALEGGFENVSAPSSVDIESPFPRAGLPIVQVPGTITEVEYAHVFQEGITCSRHFLPQAECLGLRAPWRQQRRDTPMNSF